MAARLLDPSAGFAVTVCDVAADRAQALASQGARMTATPRAVAEACDVVLTAVPDGAAVFDVLQGPDGLLAARRHAGKAVLVEMSTIGVEESARVAALCFAAGLRYVRCPVLGTLESAAEGQLTALVSGAGPDVEAVQPVLARLCREQRYLGPAEEARLVKLIVNGLLGTSIAALAEGLALGQRAGINRDALLDLVAHSAVASPAVVGTAQRLRQGTFEPRLSATLLTKDLRLLNEAAADAGALAPMAEAAHQRYAATVEHGWGDLDFSAVLLLYETLNEQCAHRSIS